MSLEQAIQELTAAVKENTYTTALSLAGKTIAPKTARKTAAAPPASEAAPAAASAEATASATASASPAAADTAPVESAATTTPAASDKPLTDVDVRSALVALQTRKGTRTFSQAILDKYTSGAQHVIGSLKKEDYAKVVAECEAIK